MTSLVTDMAAETTILQHPRAKAMRVSKCDNGRVCDGALISGGGAVCLWAGVKVLGDCNLILT